MCPEKAHPLSILRLTSLEKGIIIVLYLRKVPNFIYTTILYFRKDPNIILIIV